MLAEIPRKTVFPEHVVLSEISRIEQDVENEVIPVSAGIYSEYKLAERLQAIPKPVIVDYEDPIFYDLAQTNKMPCRSPTCPLCSEEFGTKQRKPVQCQFCGVWNCTQCICPRKRYHPRAKESNSERYDICYSCDDKFLSLSLNHGYVERRNLLEQVVRRVKKERDSLAEQIEQLQEGEGATPEAVDRNKFKISALKKEKIDSSKQIAVVEREKKALRGNIEIRQQYLTLLLQKRKQWEKERGRPKERDEMIQRYQKPKKTLSQTKVFSEAISQESPKEEYSDREVMIQKENNHALQYPEEPTSQPQDIPVHNFFNFHEWGSSDNQKVLAQQQIPTNDPIEDKTNKFNENETLFESDVLNNAVDSDTNKEYRQKRLAEIFKKEETEQDDFERQLMEGQLLEGQALEDQKREIVRASIEMFQTRRMMMAEEIGHQASPQKCTCHIY